MRRAVFGGSFDPVHNGHVNLVKQIYEAVPLDEIIIMPAHVSPFKQDSVPASEIQRLEMCRLAFNDIPYVTVSDYEISRPEVSYTVNTIRHLWEIYPGDELFFIMGSDMLMSFEKWYRYEEILSMCTIIAASREDGEKDMDILKKQAAALEKYGRVMVVSTGVYVMSSTEIREKLKNSSDISCYVPENVVKYILDNRLYMEK
ncbi:MAG: nicotinate (nicotinamide) nucleotide adenylyltransferase [Oscillospiraceae bacterium]|nr:nicotinate (nicotinamide) nucleotide adenylyltransferase [Oscillospiraceae bacterium]